MRAGELATEPDERSLRSLFAGESQEPLAGQRVVPLALIRRAVLGASCVLLVSICACGHSPSNDRCGPERTTAERARSITWPAAVRLIDSGRVRWVEQAHSRDVSIYTDLARYDTKEPHIDDVHALVLKAPNTDAICYLTE